MIILVAVGTGSSKSVQDSISALGSNTLTVSASSTGVAGGAAGLAGRRFPGLPGGGAEESTSQNATQTRAPELTMADAEAIATSDEAPDVLGVAPVVSASSVTATYEGASHAVSTFTGTTPAYLRIDNTSVAAGRSFTDGDYTNARPGGAARRKRRRGPRRRRRRRSWWASPSPSTGLQFEVVGILA